MESCTLTIAADSEGLKNGKAFLFLVALLCTISLLSHAACCGSYWVNNVVESCELAAVEERAAHEINSTGLVDFGRFTLSSICSVINHIIGHNDASLYINKPFCVISRVGPVEVPSIWIAVFSEHVEYANKEMHTMTMPDDMVIGKWKTQVIDSLEFVLFTVQFGTHHSLWIITVKNWSCQQEVKRQLILNSEEGVGNGECRFSTVNEAYLEWLSLLGGLKNLEKSKPIAFWSGLKKTSLVVSIMILLVTCVVLPQLIENGRISAASVPKFAVKAMNMNCNFQNLPSEPEALKIEDLSKSSNDSPIPEKLDTIVEKEKSSIRRRKRRSSGSSRKSTHSSSPLLSIGTAMKTKAVKKEDNKPIGTRIMDENNPLFLFPFSNDRRLLVPSKSLALHARAPGPKGRNQERMNTTIAIIDDQYRYDIWADHLSGIAISELWNSFFVMGPLSFKANSQAEESVSSPHKDKDD